MQIYEPGPGQPVEPPQPPETPQGGVDGISGDPLAGPVPGPFIGGDDGPDELHKYIVGGSVNVAVARERVQYLNADGKLVTESLREHTRINLGKAYDSLDGFLQAWNSAERKAALIEELEGRGVFLDALADRRPRAATQCQAADIRQWKLTDGKRWRACDKASDSQPGGPGTRIRAVANRLRSSV